jgi:hypothetical protein
MLCGAVLCANAAPAQNTTSQLSFHASKAEVERALLGLQSYPGGKLPVLEGFAAPTGGALTDYKRGHYEYGVRIKTLSPTETTIEVTAKITAWYAATPPANSGYRVLKSSGRLESDLLDALSDKLSPDLAANAAAVAITPALPDAPSAGTGSFFNTHRLTTAPSTASPPPAPARNVDQSTAKQIAKLQEQARNLEQILQGQARPNNLAVVKQASSPVLSEPLNSGARVLLQAEAEDEFEILDSTEGWIHVKISGMSRGWIQRDYVDLPGATTISVADISGEQHDTAAVRQTKEEVASFPGKWEPLDGKQVKVIWVQPLNKDQFGAEPKWPLAKSVFRGADARNPADPNQVAGVVVIFDSEDGGMAATTLANLQQWRAGHLSDESFWKRCWRDPAEVFQGQN